MTARELYYLGLSEIYLAEVEDLHGPIVKILQAKGVVVEIESDLLSFVAKNGDNERSIKQAERIGILKEAFNHIDKVSAVNVEMRVIIRKNSRDIYALQQEISELKRELEIKNKSLDD